MQTIQATAVSLLQAAPLTKQSYTFLESQEPCFLIFLAVEDTQLKTASISRELLAIALSEQACLSVQGLSKTSLWLMTADAASRSKCNVYLNLDLLTIDEHVQDWGDFKIKPEQVEVQRNELTHAALFNPRFGFVVQVMKTALPTFMSMLRTAHLEQHCTTIGKTWGTCESGGAVLDIYRDAKKQISISAQDILALKAQSITK